MTKNTPLFVAGLVFAIVAIVHLLRLYYKFGIVIAGYEVPMDISVAGFLIALILSIWMFVAFNIISSK